MSFEARNLSEPDDVARGISVALVALRWNAQPISRQQLRERAATAVAAIDKRYDKDVMDVNVIEVNEQQQYVQLAVRANFASQAECRRMATELKQEFGELPKRKWYEFWK